MPHTEIDLPLPGSKLRTKLTYLDHRGTSDIGYLQRIRSMANLHEERLLNMEQRYKAGLVVWPHKLAAQVDGPVTAIVSPPSSRPELIKPYRDELLAKFQSAIDLTERFRRPDAVSAGEGASGTDLLNAIRYQGQGDEAGFQTVLAVDDVVASGKTVGAVISKLRAAGMPKTSAVLIAAPLWLG